MTRRTFGDALPPVPRVAGDAAAAEAGGEVPALRVHGALVPAVGARRPGVSVVAENCAEETASAREQPRPGRGAGRACTCARALWGRSSRPVAA